MSQDEVYFYVEARPAITVRTVAAKSQTIISSVRQALEKTVKAIIALTINTEA